MVILGQLKSNQVFTYIAEIGQKTWKNRKSDE